MAYEHILVASKGPYATITLNRPEKRNALSLELMRELIAAFGEIGGGDTVGVIVAANGSVFSAGHDFADMAGADLVAMRELFATCTEMMTAIQQLPQPVIARVHALATAAGCQLVASCDLAVAADSAGFAAPGGKGGLFCHTPMVAIARNVGRKRAFEMALTGDIVDAVTAAQWGFINKAVPLAELDDAVSDLLSRACRGSSLSKAMGKQTLYAQLDLPQDQAYRYAVEMMAAASQTHDAKEGVAAFLEKRKPKFIGR